MSSLNKEQKVHVVANSPQVKEAIKLLIGLMHESEISEFIEYTYDIDVVDEEKRVLGTLKDKFKFRFEKIKNT